MINVPRFSKYPKIPYLEEDKQILSQNIDLFEKVDGALTQVRMYKGNLFGGSKANFLTGEITSYSWFPNFLKWMRRNDSLYKLPEKIVMYGEWLVPVVLEYDQKNLNKFYFIDLAHVSNGKPTFFDHKEAVDYLNSWKITDIEILPKIGSGLFSEDQIINIRENTKSQLREGNMEGLVLKNYRTQQFTKTLNLEYSEIREDQKKLEKYLNLVRVKKALRRLQDEKCILKPTMEQLVTEVSSDISIEAKFTPIPEAVKSLIRVKGYY